MSERILPFILRLNAMSSSASGPSVSSAGRREIRFARIFSRVRRENSSSCRVKLPAFASCTLAEKVASTSSAGIFVCMKLR